MNINEMVFKDLQVLIKVGLETLQNTRKYYDLVNNKETSRFLVENNCSPPHFSFLKEMLDNQEYTVCIKCGHYNANIECPIIRCEYCDTEWKVDSRTSDSVCEDCVAVKTNNCNKKPNKGNKNGTNE
jgi:hypothetical protein